LIQLAHLENLKQSADGCAWLSQLPESIERVCDQWELTLDANPFLGSTVSYVTPATQYGVPVVLKMQWPHEECRFEADALMHWNGEGAVALLAHNRVEHAMLLEYCIPGQTLAESTLVDKMGVVIDTLPKLWQPATTPFQTLEAEARNWQASLDANWQAVGQPMDSTAMRLVHRFIDELLSDKVNHVLVHQDLHAGNIISAQREPWLAIDPKPLIGEREFSVASMVRCPELGHSRSEVIDRLDRLSAELQLDRERARKWTVVQTFCWGLCDGPHKTMFDVVGWLIEDVAG